MTLRVVVFFMLCVLHAAPASAYTDGEIRIGLIGPMSGSYSDVGGPGAVVAAEMAIEEVGQAIDGVPVRLHVINNRGNPDAALSAVETRPDLDLLLTVDQAQTARVVHAHASRHGQLFIHGGGPTRGFGTEYCASTAFQWVPGIYSYAAGVRDGFADRGVRTWYFVAAREEGGDLREVLEEVFLLTRGEVLGIAEYPPGASDITPYVDEALAAGPDVIAIVDSGAQAVAAVRQAYERGHTPRQSRLAVMQLSQSDVRELGLYVVGGVRAVSPFLWSANTQASDWSERFLSRVGTKPTAVHAAVYSAVNHYLTSAHHAGTDEASRVAADMRRRPVRDVYARDGRIDADGQLIMDMYFTEVKRPHQSESAWDYFRAIDTFPAARVFPLEKASACIERAG